MDGKAEAVQTPIGLLPKLGSLDMKGLKIDERDIHELLRVDIDAWKTEIPDIAKHFAQFGDHLPVRLEKQFAELKKRLG